MVADISNEEMCSRIINAINSVIDEVKAQGELNRINNTVLARKIRSVEKDE